MNASDLNEEHGSIKMYNSEADDIYTFMKELDDIRKEDRFERYRKILSADLTYEKNTKSKKKKQANKEQKKRRKTLYEQSSIRKSYQEPKPEYTAKKISKKNVEKALKRLAPEPTHKIEKKEFSSPIRQRPPQKSEEEIEKENQKRKEAAFQKRALKFIDEAFCVESNEIDKLTEEQLEIALTNLGILNCPKNTNSEFVNVSHISDFPDLSTEVLNWRTQSRRNRGNIYSSRAAQRSIRDVFLSSNETPFAKLVRNAVIIQIMNGGNKPKPLFDPNNPNLYYSEYSSPQTPTADPLFSPRNSAAQTPTFSTSGRVQWSGPASPRNVPLERPASSPSRPPPLQLPQPPTFEEQTPEAFDEEAQRKEEEMKIKEQREIESDRALKNQALALFPVENTIDKETLTKLLKRLNLISRDINEKHSIIADFVEDWAIKPEHSTDESDCRIEEVDDSTVFDTESVRKTIADAIVSRNRTKIQSEIKVCILTARANGFLRIKKEEPVEPEPPTKKVIMTKERLDYLSHPKSPPEKKPKKSLPKRPVFKMNPLAGQDELQPNSAFSYRSKEILAESKNQYKSMKFTEREQKMEEDRQKMLKKLQRDSLKEQKRSQWHSAMTKEEQETTREKVEARKERDRQRLEEETTPSFRPVIDSDMERLKKLLRSDVQMPHGWSEEVERHRRINKKYLEETEPEKPKKNTRKAWPKPPPRVQYSLFK